MNIQVEYLNDNCKLLKGSSGAMAFDVRANIDSPLSIVRGRSALIPLGFKVAQEGEADPNVGMFLFMRSGLAAKHGLMLLNSVGVIDSDYRGEVMAAIFNTGASNTEYIIQPYERIGQVMFMSAVPVNLVEAKNLSDTVRGAGGFGSTGRV